MKSPEARQNRELPCRNLKARVLFKKKQKQAVDELSPHFPCFSILTKHAFFNQSERS